MQEGTLPPASAEMVLIGACMRALAEALDARRQERKRVFLDAMTRILGDLPDDPKVRVMWIVSQQADPDTRTSRFEASAWWSVMRETIAYDMG